jgi:hypothetical protein
VDTGHGKASDRKTRRLSHPPGAGLNACTPEGPTEQGSADRVENVPHKGLTPLKLASFPVFPQLFAWLRADESVKRAISLRALALARQTNGTSALRVSNPAVLARCCSRLLSHSRGVQAPTSVLLHRLRCTRQAKET